MIPKFPTLHLCLLSLFVTAAATGAQSPAASAARPNLVIINIDDLGYADIGPFGSKKNKTPRLDRMAAEGRVFTSFYAAAPLCSPSRAALMTGSYPRRVGLGRGSGHGVLFPGDDHALNPNEITIAEILRDAGYATGCFGKWHLGDQKGFLPTDQGFDKYYGIPYSNDMWPYNDPASPAAKWKWPRLPILRGSEVVGEIKTVEDQADICRQLTAESVAFIRANRAKPFFLYLPHVFVHVPRSAVRKEFQPSPDPLEGQVREVDWSVGQIIDCLMAEGLDKNTLIVFTSDNGGGRESENGPLRGTKGTAFEGGQRVSMIARWPAAIPPGTVCGELATNMDLLPTFTAFARAKIPTDRVIDGRDIGPLLRGGAEAKSPHQEFFYHQENKLRAVRAGEWKLFNTGELYHLGDDLGEKTNVAAANPDVVSDLQARMTRFESDLVANSRPIGITPNPKTILSQPGVDGPEGYRPTLHIPRKP
jgi:arylsulfatase A